MAKAAEPKGTALLGRLTRSAEFQELRRGQKFEGKFGRMRAVARARDEASPFALRIGLIVPGRLGNAPQRNRIKRRLREGMRRARLAGALELPDPGKAGRSINADIGIFASRAVLTMDFDALAMELKSGVDTLMRKLGRRPI